MRLGRQSEIAIGILVACARAPRATMRTAEVAERAAVGKDSAAQAILILSREGFLATTRGRFGGVALAKPARDIPLGDVLRRLQPDLFRGGGAQATCPPGDPASAFSAIVGAAEATFLAFLDRFSVADLAACRNGATLDLEDCRLNGAARPSQGVRRQEYADVFDHVI